MYGMNIVGIEHRYVNKLNMCMVEGISPRGLTILNPYMSMGVTNLMPQHNLRYLACFNHTLNNIEYIYIYILIDSCACCMCMKSAIYKRTRRKVFRTKATLA